MSIDPIELFLQEQAQDGQQDSEGSFTVSGDRALKKLAEYQLPRTSAWILKMVQAGVAAGAESLRVQQTAKSTQIRYSACDLGNLDELLGALTSPTPTVTRAQEHLLVGLRTAAFARSRPVLLTRRHPEEGSHTLFWNGTRFSAVQDARLVKDALRRPDRPELTIHVAGSPLGPDKNLPRMKGLNDTVASEFKELQSQAVTCPVPLHLDARRVDHFGLEDVSMQRGVLVFGYAPEAQGLTSELPLSGYCLRDTQQEPPPRVACAWTLYENSSSPEFSKVCWVKDGVICQERHLDSHVDKVSMRLFLPADEFETDLTGLQLRLPETAEVQRRIGAAVRAACQGLKFDEQGQMQLEAVAAHTQRNPWSMAFLSVIGGVLAAPFTGGASVLMGIGGAAVSFASGSSSRISGRRLEAFRSQLESRFSL